MVAKVVAALIANFPLTFLVLGFLVASVAIARLPRPRDRATIVDRLLAWYVFFAIGVTNAVNFVFHVFFGEMTARYIGWADSPFQLEVGMASLGFALVAFVAAFRSFDLRLAAVLGPSAFLLGAAGGHIYQMIAARNFAPGNAGVVFWMDIAVPLIGFTLLAMQRRLSPMR